MSNVKPKVFISRCLGFAACRWNGVSNPSELVELLKPFVEVVHVCPEMEIGLGVPRPPIRIIELNGQFSLYQPETGKDVTEPMTQFAKQYLDQLSDMDGFILKSKSPSCGLGDVKIYPANSPVPKHERVRGIFGREVFKKFSDCALEDDTRLTNYAIREHFLIKLFTLARFRQLQAAPSLAGLVAFQNRHKLIFLACNQKHMRLLGKICANHQHLPLADVLTQYKNKLLSVFEGIPKPGSHINVLSHAFGYVSPKISPEERKFYLDLQNDYLALKVPLSALIGVLKSWLIRFNETYLLNQYYFDPFPKPLIQLTDSGKGRELKS
jgi:uncharacterized protein YbgA (DUF1722 family)/uncharacterized protein YbbK (DUF523 family)